MLSPLLARELRAQPWACQADLLEAGSVLATLLPFPGIGRRLLPPPPALSPVLTLLFSPLLWGRCADSHDAAAHRPPGSAEREAGGQSTGAQGA